MNVPLRPLIVARILLLAIIIGCAAWKLFAEIVPLAAVLFVVNVLDEKTVREQSDEEEENAQ